MRNLPIEDIDRYIHLYGTRSEEFTTKEELTRRYKYLSQYDTSIPHDCYLRKRTTIKGTKEYIIVTNDMTKAMTFHVSFIYMNIDGCFGGYYDKIHQKMLFVSRHGAILAIVEAISPIVEDYHVYNTIFLLDETLVQMVPRNCYGSYVPYYVAYPKRIKTLPTTKGGLERLYLIEGESQPITRDHLVRLGKMCYVKNLRPILKEKLRASTNNNKIQVRG